MHFIFWPWNINTEGLSSASSRRRESFPNKRRRRNGTGVTILLLEYLASRYFCLNTFFLSFIFLFFYFRTLCVFSQRANLELEYFSPFFLSPRLDPGLISVQSQERCKIKCVFWFLVNLEFFSHFVSKHHKLTSWLSVAHEPQKNDARLLNFSKSMLE